MDFQIFMPTRILFAKGAINKLAEVKLPGKKAIIVISSGQSMKKNGYLDKVVELLRKQGVESVVFDKIQPNPVSDTVTDGAAFAKENECDFVIGLGGGSSIDSAKSIALMASNPGHYWDYIVGGTGKGKTPPNKALPVVAIPTTAGTGTEADPWTVITNSHSPEKIGYGIDDTFPVLSIVDPELMTSVPPFITAYTGIDAFCHASEAYVATCAQPISDLLALDAIKHIAQNLKKAVSNPEDVDAREKLAWACTAAGLCETYSSCIGNHSVEHALSAHNEKLPHGVGLALVGPSFFEYIMDTSPERFLEMAKAMNPKSEKSQDFIVEFKKLISDSGLDNEKLSDYGYKPEQFKEIAQNSFETMGGLFELTPKKLDVDDVAKIIENAYQ